MEGKRLNILLVANHSATVDIVRHHLEQSGTRCRLLTVGAGPTTLPYLRREGAYSAAPRPDLVLFDVQDADEETLKLVRRIKRSPQLRPLPFVLLTHPDAPLPEDVDVGRQRYTSFSPVSLENFLDALSAIQPDRFISAIALLEEFGFVLVEMPLLEASMESRTGTY